MVATSRVAFVLDQAVGDPTGLSGEEVEAIVESFEPLEECCVAPIGNVEASRSSDCRRSRARQPLVEVGIVR